MKLAAGLWIAFLSCTMFPADQETPRLLLKVDKRVSGPFGGQRSSECLRIYSNGHVSYAYWVRSGGSFVDKETGQSSHPEKIVSLQYAVPDRDTWEINELGDFVQSEAVNKLPDTFGPPHQPIDYFETTKVELPAKNGHSKQITTREYYVASLREKAKYPSALIILMDRIDQIEKQASENGKPAAVPPDCVLHE